MSIPTGLLLPSADYRGAWSTSPRLPADGGQRIITHNYCDKCTWWHESTEHVDQATTTADELTYTITGHDSLIDIRHARLTFEDMVDATTVTPKGVTMTNILPTVKVNGMALAQSNEDAQAGNDRYSINYDGGTVTFGVARTLGDTVVVSFRKAGSSTFTVKPSSGKKLVLEDVEIDLSSDVDLVTPLSTIDYGSHTVLTGGAVLPLLQRTYKTFHDFQAAARRFYGPIPVLFGGSGGVNAEKWTFEWQYLRSDSLYDTPNYRDQNIDANKVTGNYVELFSHGGLELPGSFLTVTFYAEETGEDN